MKRYLILTPLDVLHQTNNREHHLIRHLAPRFEETVVVFRKRCLEPGIKALIRDAFWPRARVLRKGNVTYVEANPLFNHVQGLAMDISGSYRVQEGAAARQGWRDRIRRLISGAGILQDLSNIFFLFYYSWRHGGGRFDVATAMGPWGNAPAWLLKRCGRIRTWVYEDRDYEAGFMVTPLRRRMAEWLEVAALRRADLRISIGYRLAALRREQSGLPVELVPTGVDASGYSCPPRELDSPTLVYTGNVTYWSGLDQVIAALPAISELWPDIRLTIVGESLAGYQRKLEQLAAELGVGERVLFMGRVDNSAVPQILQQAHVGIATFQPMSLRRYAASLKVLEYMAAGLVLLTTAGTESADWVAECGCGVCVPFTTEGVQDGLRRILADREDYKRMAVSAQAWVRDREWAGLMDREYALLTEAFERTAK